METNRTLQTIRTYNAVEKNHWQLMCDLSNNDYDIDYFGGKVTICDNFECFLQTVENFNIDEILKYLNEQYTEVTLDYQKYFEENGFLNMNYLAALQELEFLIHVVKQDYEDQ